MRHGTDGLEVIGQYGFTLNRRSNFLRAAGIVFLPLALIVLQKETGSALVYFAFFLMFYREGMPGSILFCGAAAVVYFVVGIGQGETVLPGTLASVGETVVLALVWLFDGGFAARLRAARTGTCAPHPLLGHVAPPCGLRRFALHRALRHQLGAVGRLHGDVRLFGHAVDRSARQHLPAHRAVFDPAASVSSTPRTMCSTTP